MGTAILHEMVQTLPSSGNIRRGTIYYVLSGSEFDEYIGVSTTATRKLKTGTGGGVVELPEFYETPVVTSTNSIGGVGTTWTDVSALAIASNNILGGTYIVEATGYANANNIGNDYMLRLTNAGALLEDSLERVEAKDPGTDQRIPFILRAPLVLSANAVVDLKLQQTGSNGVISVTTYNCYMTMQRKKTT